MVHDITDNYNLAVLNSNSLQIKDKGASLHSKLAPLQTTYLLVSYLLLWQNHFDRIFSGEMATILEITSYN